MDYLAALNPFQLLSLGSKKVVLNKEDCDSNQKKALEELLALFDDKVTPGEALGYLKFRNWKVAEAAAQLRSTLCWRQSGCNRVCISDVARFMRGPPDGCIVCLEDMKGGCARDLLGRPVIASIGMLHGSLQDMRAQMIYAMERAKLYQQSSNSVHSSSVVIEVVPRTGASATFRFPDSNTKLLMETQRQHYPGTLASTTHFCGIPSAITWAFALCKPFMDAESYNNMVLRPDHSHLSPTYISKENLLKEWGGTFAFTLEEYLKWRAEEEGVTLDESDVQRYDASAAEKISSDDMLEALVAISVVEHKLSATKVGTLRKQGNGQGFFASRKWKDKLMLLMPGGLALYFDSLDVNDAKNMPSKVISLSGGAYVDPSETASDGVTKDPLAFQIVTPARNFTFAAVSQESKEEWISAIRACIASSAVIAAPAEEKKTETES